MYLNYTMYEAHQVYSELLGFTGYHQLQTIM